MMALFSDRRGESHHSSTPAWLRMDSSGSLYILQRETWRGEPHGRQLLVWPPL